MNAVVERMSAAEYRALMAGKSSSTRQPSSATHPRRQQPEEDLHRECFKWLEEQKEFFPILAWAFHCPNGGRRSKGEAGKLKALGVKPGVPDVVIPLPYGTYAGLAIELKSGTGTLSDHQKDWLRVMKESGYLVGVARDLDTFVDFVMHYLRGAEKQEERCI